MDYEKKYKEALEKAKSFNKRWQCVEATDSELALKELKEIFPELKESEDELTWLTEFIEEEVYSLSMDIRDNEDRIKLKNLRKSLAWLEKQSTPNQYGKADIDKKLSEEEQNRFAKGVLTSCALSFIDYLDAHKYEGKMCVSNGECEDIENAFHNAIWDRLHRYYCKYIEKQGEQKPTDKVEPRFKVKYAGSEYNVLEVKDIAGVTFYGIEDEPNHIDYVKAENCEIISGYAIKENGSQYPTKPAVFSEKKPTAWGEEDDYNLQCMIAKVTSDIQKGNVGRNNELIDWLKSIKERVQPQPKQEWSEEDENYLQSAENACEYQYGKNTSTILWLKSLKDRL